MKAIKKFFKWVFMKKKDITDPGDLYFYHTKRILVVLTFFLAVSFLSALTFISLFQTGEMAISVPDVVGKPLVSAQLRLQQDDLLYKIKTKRYPDKPEGVVIEQEPRGGSSTKKMRAVVLFINTPAAAGTLPNLSGLLAEDAVRKLNGSATSNFKPFLFRRIFAPSDSVPVGRVISQSPDWGVPHPSPVYVTLLVSSGPAATGRTMPSFGGQPVNRAMEWLSMNGIPARIRRSATAASGVVSAQTPAPGSPVSPASLAILTTGGSKSWGVLNLLLPRHLKLAQLNLKKPATSVSTNSTLNEAEQKIRMQKEEEKRQQSLILSNPANYKVTVRVRENGTSTTLLEEVKRPGDRILVSFSYSGTAVIEVRINDMLFFTRSYR